MGRKESNQTKTNQFQKTLCNVVETIMCDIISEKKLLHFKIVYTCFTLLDGINIIFMAII